MHGPHIQNFTEVYKLLKAKGLSSKFNNIEQLVLLIDKSFKRKINYKNKIIKLKKVGSNILNKTFSEINCYL